MLKGPFAFLELKVLIICINISTLSDLGELRNVPDKNDSNNGNEHVGMQKRC